jgi:DNA-binding transcriptional LysR family regulator
MPEDVPQPNLNFVRTFCLVAKCGGIAAARKELGLTISCSAISQQITKLEQEVKTQLCERDPFRLFAEGERIVSRWGPVLADFDASLQQRFAEQFPLLRIGGSRAFTHGHWPEIRRKMRAMEPRITFEETNGSEEQLWEYVERGRIDLAVLPTQRPIAPPYRKQTLLLVPMVLLGAADGEITSGAQLWALREITVPLILPLGSTTLVRTFREKLQALGVEWPCLQSSPLSDHGEMVARGEGIALSLLDSHLIEHPGVRVLPLKNFPPIEIGVMWRAPASPVLKRAIGLLKERARQLRPPVAIPCNAE